jgi:hypothetical protein
MIQMMKMLIFINFLSNTQTTIDLNKQKSKKKMMKKKMSKIVQRRHREGKPQLGHWA